jgi:hypothetical protein
MLLQYGTAKFWLHFNNVEVPCFILISAGLYGSQKKMPTALHNYNKKNINLYKKNEHNKNI